MIKSFRKKKPNTSLRVIPSTENINSFHAGSKRKYTGPKSVYLESHVNTKYIRAWGRNVLVPDLSDLWFAGGHKWGSFSVFLGPPLSIFVFMNQGGRGKRKRERKGWGRGREKGRKERRKKVNSGEEERRWEEKTREVRK